MINNPRNRTQDLREAVASIISMMLGLLRAHGLRGLLHLPTLWLVSREIRRIGERFNALFAALHAGTLVLPAPVPPLPSTPSDRHVAPRVRARLSASQRRP